MVSWKTFRLRDFIFCNLLSRPSHISFIFNVSIFIFPNRIDRQIAEFNCGKFKKHDRICRTCLLKFILLNTLCLETFSSTHALSWGVSRTVRHVRLRGGGCRIGLHKILTWLFWIICFNYYKWNWKYAYIYSLRNSPRQKRRLSI